MKGYKTAKQAAGEIGLSVEAILYRIKHGKLRGIKEGRDWFIADADVKRAKEKGKLPPGPTPAPGAKKRIRKPREPP